MIIEEVKVDHYVPGKSMEHLKWIAHIVGQVWVPGMGMKQLKVTC